MADALAVAHFYHLSKRFDFHHCLVYFIYIFFKSEYQEETKMISTTEGPIKGQPVKNMGQLIQMPNGQMFVMPFNEGTTNPAYDF